MNGLPENLAAPEFKDRRVGLIIFGVVVIVLGCLCGLLVPLMLFSQVMAARMTGEPPNFRMIVPGLLMYGGLAVAFVWLGIGSIRARRWARALLLILSWAWLVVGAIAVACTAIFLPQILETMPAGKEQLPAEAKWVVITVALAFLSVLFLIVPAVLVGFYQGRHVKATCEARDPVPRWTDACPLPVLGLSLLLAVCALTMLTMPLAYNSVAPFFGHLLSGVPGTVLFVAVAGLWAYAARALYRLNPVGWWVALITFGLLLVSNAITFSRVELIEMYRLMGYPEAQIEQMEQFSFLQGRAMAWWSVFAALPLLGYVLYVKRFFRQAG